MLSAARAARLELGDDERAALASAFGRRETPRAARRPTARGEVVLVMGIPGAGKSRHAGDYVARGYHRLNRDEHGGTLRRLAGELDRVLSDGTRRVVLDNTYLTRSLRSHVIETAARHGVEARCIWLDTPLAQAQVNLVERLLDRFGSLPTPEQLRERSWKEEGLLAPTSQMRAARELEPPSTEEGLTEVVRVPFTRTQPSGPLRPGVLVAAAALRRAGGRHPLEGGDREAPHLVFDWSPGGSPDDLADVAAQLSAEVPGPVETALCPHGAGPPVCWCRPPLPGLPLAFARAHGIDLSSSTLVGTGPAHRTLAAALGARYVPV